MPLDVSGAPFEAIRGWVSHPALRLVQEQRQLLSKPTKASCTQTFTSSYGLPCVHTLKKLEEEGQALSLQHFHPHWHLKRDVAQPQPILEPRIAATQRNGRRAHPTTSTRRDPSAFEAVEAVKRPKAQPKCTRCHTLGHTMASKACPLRYEDLFQLSKSTASVAGQMTKERVSTTVEAATAESTAARTSLGDTEAPITAPVQPLMSNMAADHTAASQTSVVPKVADCIVVDQAEAVHTATPQTAAVQALENPTEPIQAAALRYDDPRAIYQRYAAARDAWYKAQPRGCIKTNQQYRKAMGLPQRYDKASYQWCFDWKQMGKHCAMQKGFRDWTKEEMMAYLDWSKAEEDRVEARVAAEMAGRPFSSRRGMRDIWEAAAIDSETQEAFFSGR